MSSVVLLSSTDQRLAITFHAPKWSIMLETPSNSSHGRYKSTSPVSQADRQTSCVPCRFQDESISRLDDPSFFKTKTALGPKPTKNFWSVAQLDPWQAICTYFEPVTSRETR